MVLNDIIEQAAGRHSRASDHGGKIHELFTYVLMILKLINNNNQVIFLLTPSMIMNKPKKCICCKLNLFVKKLVVEWIAIWQLWPSFLLWFDVYISFLHRTPSSAPRPLFCMKYFFIVCDIFFCFCEFVRENYLHNFLTIEILLRFAFLIFIDVKVLNGEMYHDDVSICLNCVHTTLYKEKYFLLIILYSHSLRKVNLVW